MKVSLLVEYFLKSTAFVTDQSFPTRLPSRGSNPVSDDQDEGCDNYASHVDPRIMTNLC